LDVGRRGLKENRRYRNGAGKETGKHVAERNLGYKASASETKGEKRLTIEPVPMRRWTGGGGKRSRDRIQPTVAWIPKGIWVIWRRK